MSFTSSVFSNLTIHPGKSLIGMGVNAGMQALGSLTYASRDGQLKFISARGYDNVLVYAAKRTAMQEMFATLNSLYPKYVREMYQKKAEKAYKKNQGSKKKVIIDRNSDTDSERISKQGVTFNYRGQPAPEALVLWVQDKETSQPIDISIQTYWDKVKRLSSEEASKSGAIQDTKLSVPAVNDKMVFWDLGAIVKMSSGNNVVMTKVQGRDFTRKELVSGGDMTFTVSGKIVSNYPDVYPYEDVSRLASLMQYKGVIQVSNLLFSQFNVTQVLIKDFSLSQRTGFKNEQPYTFSCVAVEPNEAVQVVKDTIDKTNLEIAKQPDRTWSKNLLDQVAASAASQASQAVSILIANKI